MKLQKQVSQQVVETQVGAVYKCEFNTRVTCLHLNCWISSCWLWARVRGVIRRKLCANLTSLHGSARKLVGLVNHQVAVGIQSARGAYWIETWPHPKSFRDLTLWELSTGIVPRECCFEFWARIPTNGLWNLQFSKQIVSRHSSKIGWESNKTFKINYK